MSWHTTLVFSSSLLLVFRQLGWVYFSFMNQLLQIRKKLINGKTGSGSETEFIALQSIGNISEGERQSWILQGI